MTRSDRRIDRPRFRTFRRQDRAGGATRGRAASCQLLAIPEASESVCDLGQRVRRLLSCQAAAVQIMAWPLATRSPAGAGWPGT